MSGPQRGTSGGYCSPDAAQCTTSVPGASGSDPSSKTISRPVTCWMCPRRTTWSIVRSRSSSHSPRVGVLAIVGRTSVSIRSITPAASRRRKGRRATRRRRPLPWCPQRARRDHRIGLDHGAVEHPGFTRTYPRDAVRRHAVRQQPHDPVGRGLAGPDDHEAVRRLGQPRELVDRDDQASSATPNGGGVVAGIVGDT